jgi:hypothetical protein
MASIHEMYGRLMEQHQAELEKHRSSIMLIHRLVKGEAVLEDVGLTEGGYTYVPGRGEKAREQIQSLSAAMAVEDEPD